MNDVDTSKVCLMDCKGVKVPLMFDRLRKKVKSRSCMLRRFIIRFIFFTEPPDKNNNPLTFETTIDENLEEQINRKTKPLL